MEINYGTIKIPPFRDSHMHFVVDGREVDKNGLRGIKEAYLRHGIFSVNEMGHKSGVGFTAKMLFKDTPLNVRAAGYAIYRQGTYGVFIGKGLSNYHEIKTSVKNIAESGADFLKLVNSGIVCSRGGGYVTPGGFDADFLKSICQEARAMQLEIRCHANSDEAVRSAVAAGVTAIEHGYFVSDETLHMMAEADVSWTPTVYALISFSSILPFSEKGYIEEVIEKQLSSMNYAASIGVRLTVGTDSGSKGVRHGESFFDELRMFQKAGLSKEQIIGAACMSHKEIEKGNFLVVKEDFINTGEIINIFYQGKQFLQ